MTRPRSAPPFLPLYVADYLADTAHLSAIEHGAYLLLMLAYWRAGGLPADESQLARIARLAPRQWTECRPTLAGLFGEGWRHSGLDAALAHAGAKSEVRREAGARGGAAKAKRATSKPLANASGPPQQNSDVAFDPPQQNSAVALASYKIPDPISYDIGPAKPGGDATETLWRDGVAMMLAMGATDRQARANIGRWLKTASDDADAVLSAIRRARDMGTRDPVALVSRLLSPVKPAPAATERTTANVLADLARQFTPASQDDDDRVAELPALRRIGGG